MTLHLDPERLQRSNLLPVHYEIQEAYRQPNRFWGLNAFQFSDMANELAWSGRQFFGQLAVEGDFLPPVLMLDGYIKALCLDTRQFIHDLSGVYRPNPFRHHDPLSCFTTELRSGKDVWSPMHNSQRIATFHERFAKTGDLEELKRQCRSVLRLIGFAEEEHAIDWRIAMDLQYLCHYMVQSVLKANEGKLDEAVETELKQVETHLIDYLEKRGMYYPSGVLPQHVGYQEEMAAQREEERIKQADVARRNQAKADAANEARRANEADKNNTDTAENDSTAPSTTSNSASTENNNVDAANVTPPPYQRTFWIEALLRDQDNRSIPNQNWWIQTPDGATHTGFTDDFGRVRLEGITQSGRCLIKFPGVNALKNGKTPPPSGDTSTTSYTVKQGDTLLRIAKAHGLGSADDIYLHEENAEFREKRPNPNVINPGDVVAVPKASDEPFEERTGYSHRFVVGRGEEKLQLQLLDADGQPLRNKPVTLAAGSEQFEGRSDINGQIELSLTNLNVTQGALDVYDDDARDMPIIQYDLQLAHLDPVDTVSGVQARCNNLGFDCGVVDGIMGRKTRHGIKGFQSHHGLEVDGIAGPKTQHKLNAVHS